MLTTFIHVLTMNKGHLNAEAEEVLQYLNVKIKYAKYWKNKKNAKAERMEMNCWSRNVIKVNYLILVKV